MAARYVNPSNVVAQGQDFYTGLPAQDQQQAGQAPRPQMRAQQQAGGGPGLTSGSYAGHGGGGGANVVGRGSGGSAGVAADRTGSDSSKSWNYKPQLNIQIARDEEKERSRVKPEPEADPPGKPEPTTKRPIPGGDDDWDPGEHPDPPFGPHPPMGPSWGGPDKPKPMGELEPGKPMGELGPGKPMGELGPGKPMGELNPAPWKMPGPIEFPGGNSWDKWAKASDAAKSGAVGRKRPDRKMPAKDAMWMATELTEALSPQSPSRNIRRPA